MVVSSGSWLIHPGFHSLLLLVPPTGPRQRGTEVSEERERERQQGQKKKVAVLLLASVNTFKSVLFCQRPGGGATQAGSFTSLRLLVEAFTVVGG